MEISIKGFRGIEDKRYRFRDGVNLVLGISGSGKSTIFKSIEWLLYGSMQKISAKGSTSATEVKMKLLAQNLSFYRKNKGPPIFRIRDDSKTTLNTKGKKVIKKRIEYTGEEANQWVLENYGSRESWSSSSYIAQFLSNNFFQSSNKIRRKIINTIAYGEEDPEEIIDRCENKIKDFKKEQEDKESRYLLLKEKFSSKGPRKPKYTREVIKKNIKEKKSLLQEKRKQRDEYLKTESKREQNQSRIEKLDKDLLRIQSYLDEHSEESPDIPLLQKLPKEIKETLPGVTDTEVLYQKELSVENARKLFAKYKLKYQPGEIEARQEKYRTYLLDQKAYQAYLKEDSEYKDKFAAYEKQRKLLEKLRSVQEPEEVFKPEELSLFIFEYDDIPIQQAEEELRLTRLAEKTLECPHCNCLLRFEKEKLTEVDQSLRNYRGEVKEAEKKLRTLQLEKEKAKKEHDRKSKEFQDKYKRELNLYHQYVDAKNQYENTQEKLSNIELLEKPTKPEKIEKPEIISNPENLEYIEPTGYSLNELKQQEKYLQNREDREKILAKLSSDRSLEELLEEQKQIRSNRTLKQSYESERKKLLVEVSNIHEEVSESEIETISKEIDTYHRYLQEEEKYSIWLKSKDELDVAKNELNAAEAQYEEYIQLRKYIVRFHLSRLTPVIESINRMANEFIQPLFDEAISLRLSTYRKTQTGQSRQQFKFEIFFREHEFDVEELSGGQKMRVSIALTLALNQFRTFPVMMFDESLSSLDPEVSRRIVQFISRKTSGITLIAAHGVTEGDYDHVVDIEG